jgi:hypothetical protein
MICNFCKKSAIKKFRERGEGDEAFVYTCEDHEYEAIEQIWDSPQCSERADLVESLIKALGEDLGVKRTLASVRDAIREVGGGPVFVEPLSVLTDLSYTTVKQQWPSECKTFGDARLAVAKGITTSARIAHTPQQLSAALRVAVEAAGSLGACVTRSDATRDDLSKSRVFYVPVAGVEEAQGVSIAKVIKAEDRGGGDYSEHFVLGIVAEPEVVDAHDDVVGEDEIRRAAHKFMESYRNMGVQHERIDNEGIRILESCVTRCDEEISGQYVRKGSWILGLRVVDDDLWKSVLKGDYTGLSLGGSAFRRDDDSRSW